MNELREQLETELSGANTPKQVEAIRIRFLGRKGSITTLAKNTDFRALTPEARKQFGQQLNELKTFAEEAITAAIATAKSQTESTATTKSLDLTLPGTGHSLGAPHPIALVQLELEDLFHSMGFLVSSGYEAETEHYNFDALNIPADHPARDMQDTYWLDNGMLMRTHTSANQVRVLKEHGAPVRAIFPGRCYRYESVDPSHETTFHQLEGLMVDRDISVATLIAVMKTLLSHVFERDVNVRLRPGFFPFVEPGFELDLNCLLCGGRGCSTCGDGWIELIPCGLVHPRVLEHGGIDPNRWGGFAFGLGLTRLAMMKFGIPDIRLFASGDVRFYEQFAVGG